MYGAFLGKALLCSYSNPKHPAKWVRWRGDVGLEFAGVNGMKHIVCPLTRVFKHIENGAEDSIYSLFMAFPKVLVSSPPKR